MRDIKALPTRYSLHLMNTSAKDGNCFEVFLNCPDSCNIDNKHAHTAKLITEEKKWRHHKIISPNFFDIQAPPTCAKKFAICTLYKLLCHHKTII